MASDYEASTPNPYAAPAEHDSPHRSPAPSPQEQRSSLAPLVPRWAASCGDMVGSALLAALVVVKLLPTSSDTLRAIVAVAIVLGYYVAFEGVLSRTPGKLLAGLKVVQASGEPITWMQAVIRSMLRLVEVNPVLLGGLPAAVCIIGSKHRQRLGDLLAGTFVVRAK